jgi:hypothetical protein
VADRGRSHLADDMPERGLSVMDRAEKSVIAN